MQTTRAEDANHPKRKMQTTQAEDANHSKRKMETTKAEDSKSPIILVCVPFHVFLKRLLPYWRSFFHLSQHVQIRRIPNFDISKLFDISKHIMFLKNEFDFSSGFEVIWYIQIHR